MLNKLTAILIVISLVVQPGCASIVGGKHQTVYIESHPPGASVKTMRNDVTGISPTEFVLKRKHDQILIFEKPGFKTKQYNLDHEIRGWFWMNILSWGIIGVIVDLVTGSAYEFEPETVTVDLEKEEK